ncbi:transposase family protein [Limibacter armeniacum]|uniref:transposase family protein n=1 Tax=Limibacter armeniacum TaxID=466084 RepID=UPI002FE60160
MKISRPRYKKSVPPTQRYLSELPDTGKSWRWARINDRFYYDEARIPNRRPTHYRSQLPPREELERIAEKLAGISREGAVRLERQRKLQARDEVVKAYDAFMDGRIREVVNFFMYRSAVRTFNIQKSYELAEAWGWLEFLSQSDNVEKKLYTQWGCKSQRELFEVAAIHLAARNLEGFKASTEAYIRKRLVDYRKVEGGENRYNFVVSGKYNNDHARKFGAMELAHPVTGEVMEFDVHEAMVYSLWMNFNKANKYTKKDVYDQYTERMAALGIAEHELVSIRTIGNYLNKFDNKVLMARQRHGKKEYDRYRPYVPRHAVKYSNSLWAIDGSSGKLAYHTVDTTGGRTRVVRKNMYFVRVIDVHSRVVLGWSYGANEDSALVRAAVQMAVKNAGYIHPKVIISDNGSANTGMGMREWLGLIANRFTTITPGNSKANPAEISVKMLSNLGRKFDNWLGVGLNARDINNTHNPDYAPRNEELPDMYEVLEQFRALVQENNNQVMQDGRTRMQWYEEDKNQECQPFDDQVKRLVFGFNTIIDMSYRRNVITVTNSGKDYSFELPNYHDNIQTIVEHSENPTSPKCKIYWDESGEMADLYSLEEEYLFSIGKLQRAAVIEEEAADGDLSALGKHLRNASSVDEQVRSFEQGLKEADEAVGIQLSGADQELHARYDWSLGDTSLDGKYKDTHNQAAEAHRFGIGKAEEAKPKQKQAKPKKEPKKNTSKKMTEEELRKKAIDML